ncbi:MAG: hypothetical protein K2K77_00540, partial [Duncaniella sp.]|nr:hypothetical protein [Duncaniella sp.]
LDSMSHEMCDSLYAKSKINEVTTAVGSASILDYHYSEPKTYKMDKFGKMTATNVDGSTRLIPEFKKYNFSASSNSVTADIKTFSKLTSPVMAGVEVLQSQSDSRGLFKKLNVCTLDPNNALTDLTVDFEHNTNFNEVTYDRYYYRPIVEYAGYQVICPALKPEPNICYNSDNHPHAIDLNLPSGTLWCCTNVGAQAPDDYGYGYTLQQAKEFEDDAWRLPTITEIEELFRVCNIIQYGNSIIAVGPNGNYITIPLSGYLYGYDSRFDQGKCMYWWSSNTELSEGEMCGWHFRYTTSYGTLSDLDGSGKYCSVRLVSRKK